ncbi:hypothetical protein [Nonomuraea glycinis]|uniref:hypothetical protein n=1 Tax=Nonomuraea glycinis TaxID=2047744 RepID=UPI0033B8494A
MNAPPGPLAARIEEFERTADPRLVLSGAALTEAEQAMRACTGEAADAAIWRLIGGLHLARYRLDGSGGEAAVAGVFLAAAAVVDPGGMPETTNVPSADAPQTWAELVDEVLHHVDPDTSVHVGLLLHALIRRALSTPSAQVCDQLVESLLRETMEDPHPSWAPEALAILGGGLLRLFAATGEPEALDDAVHVHLRAALGGPGGARRLRELAAVLGLALPGDPELIGAHLVAAQRRPGGHERSQALLALFDLAQSRATASAADADLLTFIRIGQATLDFWHDDHPHPRVVAGYAAGLVEWYVVTGDMRSLEAGREMAEVLGTPVREIPDKLGRDQLTRLGLLANRRLRRWRVGDDPADLEVAIQTLRQAVARTYAGHPDRPRLLCDLAGALVQQAGLGEHPGEATAAARSAVAACGEDDPLRPRALLLLGQALRLDLSMTAADEGIAALREALAADQEPSFLAEAYGLMSELLRRRAMDGDEGHEADLDEAVTTARRAVEAHDRPKTLSTLVKALLQRFREPTPHPTTAPHPTTPHPTTPHTTAVPHTAPHTTAATQGAATQGAATQSAAPHAGDTPDRLDTADLAEALGLASRAQGDRELRTQLRRALEETDLLTRPPGEDLARAATRLALVYDEEETARLLLRIGERRARVAGEAGPFLAATAVQLAERERLRLAIELLERAGPAFTTAGEPVEAADALSLAGSHHQELGEWEPALRAYQHAAAAYRELGEGPGEAAQVGKMGAVAARAGDPQRAIELHVRAAALSAQAGLAAEEASHRSDAAAAYLAAGDPGAARECAGRARELYQALGQAERAATALIDSARACVELGRLPTAAELITTCAAELEALGAWDDACQALDSHARLLYRLGHAEHAAACETSIVDIVRRHGQRRDPADEWLHIARRRHARGDLPAARRAFELAERAYNTIGDADGLAGVRYDLGVLGYGDNALEQAAQDFATAAEAYARLRAGAEEPAAPRVGTEKPAALRAGAEKPAALRAGAEEPAVPQVGAEGSGALRMGSDESAVPRVEAGKPAAPQAGVKESAARRAAVKESAARTMRGVCLMELDRFDAAAAEFHRALELAAGERDLTALYSVTLAEAELAMMTGRLAEAETGLLAAHGLATGDPVREAIVRERMARLVSHTGDPETLRLAGASFRDHGRPHLAALVCLRLGFAFEARGDLSRARAAFEEGLAALAEETLTPLPDAPYEVLAGRTAELVPRAVTRLAAIQRTLTAPTPDRHHLSLPFPGAAGTSPVLRAEGSDLARGGGDHAFTGETSDLVQGASRSGAESAQGASRGPMIPDELADLARELSGAGSVDLALPGEFDGRLRVEGAESGTTEGQEDERSAGPA